MNKFYIVSLGCSENALDGALITSFLKNNDWEQVDSPENAELIIINSCGFTGTAEQTSLKTYQNLLLAKRPSARIIFAGCLPAINRQAILDAGYDDVLVTPRTLHLFDSVINARIPIDNVNPGCFPASSDNLGLSFRGHSFDFILRAVSKIVLVLDEVPYLTVPRWLSQFRYLHDESCGAFIRISIGCRNTCSFCSIPRAKGKTESVPPEIVLERVRDALRRGNKNIALSCDELASYGQDLGTDIVSLLDRITALPDQFNLSLRNVHPEWIIKYWEGLKPIFRSEKISRILIPLQSGSDKILRLMKRNHTAQQYRWLVEQIRETSPRVSVRTHLLVGFPGETDEDFQETLRFIKNIQVDWFQVHCYSEGSCTPSADLPDKVPAEVAMKRAEILNKTDPINHLLIWYSRLRRLVQLERLTINCIKKRMVVYLVAKFDLLCKKGAPL